METQLPKRSLVWRFWRQTFVSAWQETELLSRGKLLTTLGVSIGALALQYELSVRTFYVTVQIIATVIIAYLVIALIDYFWNVVSAPAIRDETLCREGEGLKERLKPQLDITFDANRADFVDRYMGRQPNGQKDNFTLYRVAVTSRSTSSQTRLRVESVKLKDGRTYSNLHLRSMHRHDPPQQEIQLHPGVPEFWDVIQKADSERDWVDLTHIEKVGGILLPSETQFRIVASCNGGFGTSKIVKLEIDKNNELRFQLVGE